MTIEVEESTVVLYASWCFSSSESIVSVKVYRWIIHALCSNDYQESRDVLATAVRGCLST
jgi:hypothetical protein